MPAPQNFRSAFNGFNREDVVRYLEYINAKHAAQVSQLTSEADYLRSKAENQPDVTALEQERDALRTQVADLQTRCDALEQQLAQAAPAAPSPTMEQELEVYRRAERTERLARERAELIYHQAGSILTEAAAKVDALSTQVSPMAEQVLSQLQALVAAVDGSKGSLKEALDLIATLRPNND